MKERRGRLGQTGEEGWGWRPKKVRTSYFLRPARESAASLKRKVGAGIVKRPETHEKCTSNYRSSRPFDDTANIPFYYDAANFWIKDLLSLLIDFLSLLIDLLSPF